MARLVHQQAAGVLLLAVPAAEVVGAVHGVERPLEVHRGDLADLAGRDDLAQRRVPRGVPVVEGHDDVAAGLADRARDPPAARPVDGQRLLDDDVGPRGERPRHQLGVRVVGRGHDDDVDGLLGDHLLEAVGRVLRQPGGPAEGRRDDALVVVHPARVGVEQRDEGGDVRVLPDDRVDVHARPVAGAGHGVPQVLPRRRGGELGDDAGSGDRAAARCGTRCGGVLVAHGCPRCVSSPRCDGPAESVVRR